MTTWVTYNLVIPEASVPLSKTSICELKKGREEREQEQENGEGVMSESIKLEVA